MKALFFIQQKMKLVGLLALIMTSILITNLIFKNNLESIDQTFNSIYNDRLVPSRDLFHASEIIHSKVLMMHAYFQEEGRQVNILKEKIKETNFAIDSIITKYEKTLLIEEEQKILKELKVDLHKLYASEQQILVSEEKGLATTQEAFTSNELPLILKTLRQLETLTNIQANVGKDLIQNSHKEILENVSLSNIQIILVIIIGLFANAIILSSKMMEQKEQKFHLN